MQSSLEQLDLLLENPLFQCKLHELRLVKKYRARPQEKKVSIIMPTWNRAAIIGRAIASVLKQSYHHFELVITDDGSTDNTEEIIRDYCRQDQRLKYIRNKHIGVSHARNAGLQSATGSLIAYLDSDNEWSPDYLLLMVNSFIDEPAYHTIYCGIRVMDDTCRANYIRLKKFDRGALLAQNYIDMNIFMHKRFLFDELGGFDDELSSLEDWELILRYTQNAPPLMLSCCLATYYFGRNAEHLSYEQGLADNYRKIKQRYAAGS